MGSIEKYTTNCILLICIISTGYMSFLQFKYYLSNEDVSAITYHKFNAEPQDEYPTFTICLKNTEYPEQKIYKNKSDILDQAE